ncbi:Mesoderm induction early response 1 [Seminavis robusta]|uniref:Mesoderm induction early response 1 n=1 Tax=Seminavis robusta TaxID=568900 RepID=A0A9N8EQM1_9STRA|nr:Mesoderm induction early response 1 [Seminavis robusta]|eukprot:Sro1421_g271200.1 Mesoderm induction early response 1 (676) ;mRNA; f:11552-13954
MPDPTDTTKKHQKDGNTEGEKLDEKNADKMEVDDAEKEEGKTGTDTDSGEKEEDEEGPSDDEDEYHHKWLDKGKQRSGRTEYESVLVTINTTTFRVNRNDFVLLWSDQGEDDQKENEKEEGKKESVEEIWQSAGCAKVEAMWEEPAKSGRMQAMFQARWFLRKQDLSRILDGDEVVGDLTLKRLMNRMQPREVVESLEVDNYFFGVCGGPARIFFRDPPTKDEDKEKQNPLPNDAFMCRYALKKLEDLSEQTDGESAADDDPRKKAKRRLQVVPYEADSSGDENDDDGDPNDISNQEKNSKKRRRSDSESDTMDEPSSGQEGSSSDDESKVVQGEGTLTSQGKIRVGPKFQVPVPAFDANVKVSSRTRNPTLVWSASKSPSEESLKEYFEKAAAILTPFAKQQLLVAGAEPFASRPFAQTDKDKRWEVSFVSTAAALAALPAESMYRECDSDALLKNLVDQNYDVEAAVGMVSASPRDFLSRWTLAEREGFDGAFRNHGGSLRSVATSLSSLSSDKTHRQIIDYYYRFKIPGQFQRYREKMREQAVRMSELLETKRFQENREVQVSRQQGDGSATGEPENKIQGGEKGSESANWSDTGTGDVSQAVEGRRSDAKQLLLDIQRELGKDKMAEVGGAIISLNQGSEVESKEALLRILKNHPQLHQRLVEFLPRRFWK